MELSARKKQILKAIIGDYIRTAEPVGSKALTEGHELPFSSATIRNEMSELEEMGYLEKPHTSAGRIPSPQGYRLYVDELMEKPGEAADDDGAPLQQTVLAKVRELDHLIQEAGKLLTSLTNYASVAITPTLTQVSIRRFEIIAVDKINFVIVVVTDSGTVKNKMVRTVSEVSKDEAELLAAWARYMVACDPDIITGYNIQNFDIDYLMKRAAALKVADFPLLGRIKGEHAKSKNTVFSSSAYGMHENVETTIAGRLVFDLLQFVRREYKLSSYTLNNVSSEFLGQHKEDVKYNQIKDLFHGDEVTRQRIASYCVKDALLPQQLLDKLNVIINQVEMARVSGVPISRRPSGLRKTSE